MKLFAGQRDIIKSQAARIADLEKMTVLPAREVAETARWIVRNCEAFAKQEIALAARTRMKEEALEGVRCRFGCEQAVGTYYVPQGCVCFDDPVQALCEQHFYKATSNGEIRMLIELPRARSLPDGE